MVPEAEANAAVVGRLAPSPSGLLHLGHARTFLLAWWSARAQGGRVLLRIEDLDGERSKQAFADAACHDLEWLGVDWDGAPSVQSAGLERMTAAVERLLSNGQAYVCTCSRADVRQAQTAPNEGATEPRYPGTCRGRWSSLAEAEAATGRRAGIRLRVREGVVSFQDRVAGPQSFDVAESVGDFLIARRSGAPAYQLAVVVDDGAQAVTEVVRGDDLLSSTARQFLLQDALGQPHPSWAHVPLVTNSEGQRLAKREASLGLTELRERGVDPRELVAWAARSAGLEASDLATPREFVRGFEIACIAKQRVVPPEFGSHTTR